MCQLWICHHCPRLLLSVPWPPEDTPARHSPEQMGQTPVSPSLLACPLSFLLTCLSQGPQAWPLLFTLGVLEVAAGALQMDRWDAEGILCHILPAQKSPHFVSLLQKEQSLLTKMKLPQAPVCFASLSSHVGKDAEVLPVYLQKYHLPNQTWLSGDLIKSRLHLAVQVKQTV